MKLLLDDDIGGTPLPADRFEGSLTDRAVKLLVNALVEVVLVSWYRECVPPPLLPPSVPSHHVTPSAPRWSTDPEPITRTVGTINVRSPALPASPLLPRRFPGIHRSFAVCGAGDAAASVSTRGATRRAGDGLRRRAGMPWTACSWPRTCWEYSGSTSAASIRHASAPAATGWLDLGAPLAGPRPPSMPTGAAPSAARLRMRWWRRTRRRRGSSRAAILQ